MLEPLKGKETQFLALSFRGLFSNQEPKTTFVQNYM